MVKSKKKAQREEKAPRPESRLKRSEKSRIVLGHAGTETRRELCRRGQRVERYRQEKRYIQGKKYRQRARKKTQSERNIAQKGQDR